MRLLNVTNLELECFISTDVPEYAILSHTWGLEEVTLQDLESGEASNKIGYPKMLGCCREAEKNGFTYVWIDTCCIDKTSSSELSEAINSMFQWYRDACICYAYLSDVPQNTSRFQIAYPQAFCEGSLKTQKYSRWFTRGWTLQELLAPNVIEFYAADWSEIGTKASLAQTISQITGIRLEILRGLPIAACNVAEKMSWAAKRVTTRAEDMAYCLLGVFDVNMPLLYGEGGTRAFLRLQEEILRYKEDYTIFAWADDHEQDSVGLFAPSISAFRTGHTLPVANSSLRKRHVSLYDIQQCDGSTFLKDMVLGKRFSAPSSTISKTLATEPPVVTGRGLRMNLYARENNIWDPKQKELYVFLNCIVNIAEDPSGKRHSKKSIFSQEPLLLRLRPSATNIGTFERISSGYHALWFGICPPSRFGLSESFELKTIYVARSIDRRADKVSTKQLSSQTRIAFQIVLDSKAVFLCPPANFDGWLVPKYSHTREPVAFMVKIDSGIGHVLVSAGIEDDKPWCHVEDYSMQTMKPEPDIPQLINSWYNNFVDASAKLYDDRAKMTITMEKTRTIHVIIKRCPRNHLHNQLEHRVYSLQVHVQMPQSTSLPPTNNDWSRQYANVSKVCVALHELGPDYSFPALTNWISTTFLTIDLLTDMHHRKGDDSLPWREFVLKCIQTIRFLLRSVRRGQLAPLYSSPQYVDVLQELEIMSELLASFKSSPFTTSNFPEEPIDANNGAC